MAYAENLVILHRSKQRLIDTFRIPKSIVKKIKNQRRGIKV